MSLKVMPTALDGVLLVQTHVFADERGFFTESYRQDTWAAQGITTTFVQDNHSRSRYGVLRGIHYQDERAPMTKLVRCTLGTILDIAVDLRVGAPTFGTWVAATLSADNFQQLLIPSGFGHAFVVLSEVAEVQYKCSSPYMPAAEGALLWNDQDIGIEWPISNPTLSARDQAAMTLQQYLEKPAFRYPLS